MGVEDALVLSEVLHTAQASFGSGLNKVSNRSAIERALRAFSSARIEQWSKCINGAMDRPAEILTDFTSR
jgi:hypothetical protein